MWPRTLYREEWDDMIKDPISDEVVQQRESLLPDILQGSINDKDNVTDAYKIAYMELEPESLNWTQSLRNIGTYYNNFVNRLGDNFLSANNEIQSDIILQDSCNLISSLGGS